MLHVLSPRSSGLFSRVITESGFPSIRTLSDATYASENLLASAVGCTHGYLHDNTTTTTSAPSESILSCLRGVPAKMLMAADVPQQGWGPTVDGMEFAHSALWLLEQGEFNLSGINLVVSGANHDEGTLFVYPPAGMYNEPIVQEASYTQAITQFVDSWLPPSSPEV